jgi:teichuronic acid biosynthesis glycosyltransferase TuaC
MKVLVFTSLYPNNVWPNHGVFIKERMTHFAKLDGCQVEVVAPVPYFPSFNVNWRWRYSQVVPIEVRDGIQVYHPRYCMTPKVGMTLYGLMLFLSVLPTLIKLQRNFNFDLIDAHFVYPDGFAAILFGWLFRKPVVISARGSDINRYSSFPVIRQMIRHTLNKAERVIAVSGALKKAIVELGVEEHTIHVVPNGVSLEKFHPIPKAEARKLLGLSSDKKMVLCVAHLTANKGVDLVIGAIKILLEKFQEKNIHLVVVGDGLLKTKLKNLASSLNLSKHVFFTGPIDNAKLCDWYSAADVFCLASQQEGWPNVILESLTCGTPVIATSVGGIPEIIRSEKIGLLTERNEAKIAETIDLALKTSWHSKDLVDYAKQYTWERSAAAVRYVFEKVLSEREGLSGGDTARGKAAAQKVMQD